MTTIVLPCTCTHEYQDKHYGLGQRVHNWAKKDDNWRCTVCGKTKSKAKREKKEAEK